MLTRRWSICQLESNKPGGVTGEGSSFHILVLGFIKQARWSVNECFLEEVCKRSFFVFRGRGHTPQCLYILGGLQL